MPSVVFSFGDTSKEVELKDIQSVQDVASNMKEVIELPNVSCSQYSLIIQSLKAFRDNDNPEEYNEEINSLVDHFETFST
tara:strand:+ start:191 stop:430 length:240 start_codon:yes stop_codon:yes gene_type:complete